MAGWLAGAGAGRRTHRPGVQPGVARRDATGRTSAARPARPQAWPTWATRNGLDDAGLRYGTGFEHLYYLLEAAVAGLGIAIAPEPLVADDLANGRLLAPWGFVETEGQWALCTAGDGTHPKINALAGWLRQQLATGR